jgi:hypothetical protein
VKTTTFATLLIAATLIFSSVGPATMVNNDVNNAKDRKKPPYKKN